MPANTGPDMVSHQYTSQMLNQSHEDDESDLTLYASCQYWTVLHPLTLGATFKSEPNKY